MPFQSQYVDVLVVGSGPAGSMLAASLSRNGIRTRIVDKRNAAVIAGQADGLNQRSLEIMSSLGLIHEILQQSASAITQSAWVPSEDGGIKRNGIRSLDRGPHAELRQETMNQGKVERMLQNNAKLYNNNDVERGVLPVSLKIDEAKVGDDDDYPVEVVLQHLSDTESTTAQLKAFVKRQDHVPDDGLYRSNIGPTTHTDDLIKKIAGRKETEEVVRAKYVVGCDGAWSWVRRQLGIEMIGEMKDHIWGVMDIVPITDFPDVRDIGLIQSPSGSMLWIPREHGLVRLYTQLTEVHPDEQGKVNRSRITPDDIFEQAKKILHPYSIDYKYCDWWTAYQVGQRVGESYHDPNARVFLAGDAVHTHSPKEGQGMNTSMQDAFNLGWKLAAVINKESPRSLLDTYQPERRPIAQRLIDLDRKISSAFSGKADENLDLRQIYIQQIGFMTGDAIEYSPNVAISDGSSGKFNGHVNGNSAGKTHAALKSASEAPDRVVNGNDVSGLTSKLHIGRRIPGVAIQQHTGGIKTSLLKIAPFDGRWRLLVFAGDVRKSGQLARVNALGTALADPTTGLLHVKHTVHLPLQVPFPYALGTESGRRVQATEKEVPLLDIVTVHSSVPDETELSHFHDVFWPMDEHMGRAYNKIHYGQDVYDWLGIAPETGCLVLLRPDQHVAWVGQIDDLEGLRRFASGCILV